MAKVYTSILAMREQIQVFPLPNANQQGGWLMILNNGQTYTSPNGNQWSGPVLVPNFAFGTGQTVGNQAGISSAGGWHISKKPKGVHTGFGKQLAVNNALTISGDPALPTSWDTVMGSDSAQFRVSSVYEDPYLDQVVVITTKSDPNSSGWQNRMFLVDTARESTDSFSMTRLNADVASGNITHGDIAIHHGASNSKGTHVFSALARPDDATSDAKSVLVINNLFNQEDTHEVDEGYTTKDYIEVGLFDNWDYGDEQVYHTWLKPQAHISNASADDAVFLFGRETENDGGFSVYLTRYDRSTNTSHEHVGLEIYAAPNGGKLASHYKFVDVYSLVGSTGDDPIKPGEYSHIAVNLIPNAVRGAMDIEVYVNGDIVLNWDSDLTFGVTGKFTIGNGVNSDVNGTAINTLTNPKRQFRGIISGMTILQTSYTASEVNNIYKRGVKRFGLETSGQAYLDGVATPSVWTDGQVDLGLTEKTHTKDNFTCTLATIPGGCKNLLRPLYILGHSGASGYWIIPEQVGFIRSDDDGQTFTGKKFRISGNLQDYGIQLNDIALGWVVSDAEFNGIVAVGKVTNYDSAKAFDVIDVPWNFNDDTNIAVGYGVIVRSLDHGETWELVASHQENLVNVAAAAKGIWAVIDHNIFEPYGLFVVGGDNGVVGISQDNGYSFQEITYIEDNIGGLNNSHIAGIVWGGESLTSITIPSTFVQNPKGWNQVVALADFEVVGNTLQFNQDTHYA